MKKQINLYQPSCYPKREKATFKQFIFFTAACLIIAATAQLFMNRQLQQTQQQELQQKDVIDNKQKQLMALVSELQKNRAPESKIREQRTLQDEIAAKQRLLASLGEIEFEVVSFSQLMKGLSLASINSISIDHFSIIDGRLNIAGQAKKGDSVPLWLAKIQTTPELADIAFEQLTISESDNGFLFQLSNAPEVKNAKVPE